ncbi:MAG: flagellar biosynthetic protein FliR [Firmicutes bacterium HGW-Firmicutes-16]|nr:MAG: flagellar biosynthetic protein FliR [Firmicutes bacterium HGW-Firmicutes-16]
MLSLSINDINIFALVFVRVGGMIFFNPLLNRKNIPTQFRIAFALGLSLLIIPTVPANAVSGIEGFSLAFALIKELFAGICFGAVFQIYYYMVFVAGDIIDMGFGLSMAKVFDPATNIQTSLSGGFFQLFFVVYFFITDCHLIFVKLIVSTFDLVGIGAFNFGADVGSFIFTQFVSAFALIMHLALPFIAASFVLEIGMGVLMKLIPQINVFSINFQFKILLGLGLLFLFALPITEFVQSYINEIFVSMQNLIGVIK